VSDSAVDLDDDAISGLAEVATNTPTIDGGWCLQLHRGETVRTQHVLVEAHFQATLRAPGHDAESETHRTPVSVPRATGQFRGQLGYLDKPGLHRSGGNRDGVLTAGLEGIPNVDDGLGRGRDRQTPAQGGPQSPAAHDAGPGDTTDASLVRDRQRDDCRWLLAPSP